ncbi:hypothetical protein ACTVCO_01500 [Sanguibacter sp. A247]|uniref:hypothetical protein n=1 Tax=unclassified Sanguibacter TaxID=2645534 RepID=UPI003FD6C8D4
MTDVHTAPRGHENSLMFDGVAPVSAPTPRADAAMLDAFAAPRPATASAFTMVGASGEACADGVCGPTDV